MGKDPCRASDNEPQYVLSAKTQYLKAGKTWEYCLTKALTITKIWCNIFVLGRRYLDAFVLYLQNSKIICRRYHGSLIFQHESDSQAQYPDQTEAACFKFLYFIELIAYITLKWKAGSVKKKQIALPYKHNMVALEGICKIPHV